MIRKHKVTFEDVDDSFAEPAHFILVLFDTQHLPPGLKTIRPYLLSDELGDKSQKADCVRSSIHVLTTWEWEQYSKTAEFWLRRDLMETLTATQRWAVQIWRVDAWTYQSMPQPLVDCQDTGRFLDPRVKE
ncbi:hypothetical protein TI39_contig450g00006 [Zymoseptoria brevis]|uniref:Uncharacterized protein n=1 Tax=Zymoseptoria brevis TaxID=1047168 RepID=A0A0F4GKN8_9PEZI|nr:hypothetical protein TI39_contig450g00006 [Zymoseptoria brevis]